MSTRFATMSVVAAFTLGALTATAVNVLSRHGEPAPVSSPASSEDLPGWDGLRQGNHAARVDGMLLFNVDSLSGDPYQDCVTLLNLWDLGGHDRAGFATAELCEPVYVNR